MDSNFKDTLLIICKLLEKHDVEYMLIGGTATALHGYYRHSTNMKEEITNKPDIDIWYNPNYVNYYNILKVIVELGRDTSEFEDEQTPNPRESFFKLEFDDFTFDILPEIKANIKFFDANKRKEFVEIDGVQIHFISYSDLIEDKKTAARRKDLEDIKQLKKIRNKKE